MSICIPETFAPLAVESVRLAREAFATRCLQKTHDAWDEVTAMTQTIAARNQTALLANLDRPESRDHWVRFGISRHIAIFDLAASRALHQYEHHRNIRARWHALRDSPDKLLIALLELPNAR